MTFVFEGKQIAAEPGESVLDALLRAGEPIDHGCKAGACQACVLRSVEGSAPSDATKTLDDSVSALGGFLSCRAKAGSIPAVGRLDPDAMPTYGSRVEAIEPLAADIVRIVLGTDLAAKAGQFVRWIAPDGLARCYSVAQAQPSRLELHVRLIPGGRMSDRIARLGLGERIDLRGPFGRCFFRARQATQPLLLIASSTGLAPLYGVMKDALAAGHRGAISLYHGAATSEGLYLREELEGLAESHPSLRYVPCADRPTHPSDREGSPLDLALRDLPDLEGWTVYLCGNPGMVRAGQKRCFLAGADLQDLFADPFEEQAVAA